MLTRPAVAASILDHFHRQRFGPYFVAAFLDTVEVDARDTFY